MIMSRDDIHHSARFKQLLEEQSSIAIAQSFIHHPDKHLFHFSKVQHADEWQQLGKFRLQHYQERKQYLLSTLNARGFDAFDATSDVYAAYYHSEMVATIRLSPYPFETCQFIDDTDLKQFLGNQYQRDYLEWSRLLIKAKLNAPGLLPATIVFAGIQSLLTTRYFQYFGYATPIIKRLFTRFLISQADLSFHIPIRGMHTYTLIKGNFLDDLIHLVNK